MTEGPTTAKKRVLIADDEPNFAEATRLYFEAEGFEARGATDAVEALQITAEWQPHVIITDLYKPGQMTGIEMTRRLKADERTKHIPVLVASASLGGGWREEVLEAGATAVIAKPLEPEELLATARGIVGE